MSKERETGQGGRLLFTDFDATAKGRPAAARDGGASPVGILETRLPTLEEVAGSLGITFEDDGETTSGRLSAPLVPRISLPAAALSPREDASEEIALPFPEEAARAAPAGVSTSAPIWEDYVGVHKQPEPSGLPGSEVLPSVRRGPESSSPTERREGAIAFAVPEADDDLDILSMLAPAEEIVVAEEEWRGQRLGVRPPRSRPYGGLTRLEEWYRPPEEAEGGEGDVRSIPDWYEPPKSSSGEDAIAAAFASKQKARRSGSTTRRFARADQFSTSLLEAAWEEKVRQNRKGGEGTPSATGDGERDPFSDFDVESAWEQKTRKGAGRPEKVDDTVILDEDPFSGGGTTVLLPHDERLDSPSRRLTPGARGIPRATTAKREARPRPKPEKPPLPEEAGGELRFPDDEGSFADRAIGAEPEGQGAKARPTSRTSRRTPPASIEELEIADLIPDESGEGKAGDESDAAEGRAAGEPEELADDPELAALLKKAEEEAKAEEAARAEKGTRRRRSIEDLLDGGEFDSDGAGAETSVAAPVISDSDIHPARVGPGNAAAAVSRSGGEEDADSEDGGLDAAGEGNGPPVEAPVIDDSAIRRGGEVSLAADNAAAPSEDEEPREGDAPGGDGSAAIEETADGGGEKAPVLDPMDVFSSLENMDFSGDGGLDDDMRAMLDEDKEGGEGEAAAQPAAAAAAPEPEVMPSGFAGRLVFLAKKALGRVIPASLFSRVTAMIAWRENWWFYCDLLAAIIASASLAVIVSYYIWYR